MKKNQVWVVLSAILVVVAVVTLWHRPRQVELVTVLPDTNELLTSSPVVLTDLTASAGAQAGDIILSEGVGLVGGWSDTVSRRASMAIDPAGDGRFDVAIAWGGSAWQTAMWTFTGTWDEITKSLVYSDGVYKIQTYADDGTMSEEILGSNQSGYLKYQDGFLYWHDDAGGPGEGAAFEPMSAES